MRNRIWLLLAIVTGAGLLAAAWLGWNGRDREDATTVATAQALQPMAPRATRQAPQVDVALSAEDRTFIKDLREKFSARMESKHSQIRLIEQLVAYLMQHYPDDWQTRVQAFLRELFPALADALYDKFERLMRYNDWLRVNRERLLAMPPGERRQALWAARAEAFGADAQEIFAAQRQGEQVRDALAGLDAMQGASVGQKLDVFLDAINEAYGDAAADVLDNRGPELMNGFLAVESVQDDLHALAPAERAEALRGIRRGLGLDEGALARWDSLDQDRDAAWDNGSAYMADREKIQREYDGAEEEAQLRELQERRFGADAEVIRSEEAAGFYRYQHRRRYGRE